MFKKVAILLIFLVIIFSSKTSFATDFSNYTFKCPINK